MRSQKRQERRLAKEQDTVGAQRDERREQARLGAQSNLEIVRVNRRRPDEASEPQEAPVVPARRQARPGKPLKR